MTMTKYSDIEIETAKNLLEHGYMWIVRYESGRLFAHSAKPTKVDNFWGSIGDSVCVCKFVPIFQSIRFGDKEPTSLERIVHPQILDDVERRYLSTVIRPFRNRVEYIVKSSSWCNRDHCCIKVGFHDLSDDMKFPLLREDDMYKGMELDRNYSLEELGL